jgi:hypothetical protein
MPPTKTDEPTLLDRLYEQRAKRVEEWTTRVNDFEAERGEFEQRSAEEDAAKRPTDDEREAFKLAKAAFDADNDQREAEIKELDKRIADQNEIVRRRKEAADAHKDTTKVGAEPLTYRRDNGRGEGGISYYRDLAVSMVDGVTFSSTTKSQALERLNRHAAEMEVEIPKRVEAAERRARAAFSEDEAEGRNEQRGVGYDPFHRGALYNPVEKRVEPNRTDGYGGYFIPPLWLPEEYIPGLRAHLVAAGLCRQLDLPPGTDSINIPKLANLTAVGYQTADAAGVVSQDWTDTFVQANVKTAAGQSDVALQLLEQSPNGITDEVITTDLMSAYNQFVDQQVISGDGLNTGQLNGGHIQGLYNGSGGSAWSNANSVTWTSGTPKPYSFVQVAGAMASQIARTRFDAENFKLVLHGRRWFWYSTGLDGNDRPLGESPNGGPYNVSSLIESGMQAEGLVGTLPSVANAPVYIDDNIGTTDTTGGGSNQDYAIAALWDDMWLFMGDLRTNVYKEVLSGSLGVRFQVTRPPSFPSSSPERRLPWLEISPAGITRRSPRCTRCSAPTATLSRATFPSDPTWSTPGSLRRLTAPLW